MNTPQGSPAKKFKREDRPSADLNNPFPDSPMSLFPNNLKNPEVEILENRVKTVEETQKNQGNAIETNKTGIADLKTELEKLKNDNDKKLKIELEKLEKVDAEINKNLKQLQTTMEVDTATQKNLKKLKDEIKLEQDVKDLQEEMKKLKFKKDKISPPLHKQIPLRIPQSTPTKSIPTPAKPTPLPQVKWKSANVRDVRKRLHEAVSGISERITSHTTLFFPDQQSGIFIPENLSIIRHANKAHDVFRMNKQMEIENVFNNVLIPAIEIEWKEDIKLSKQEFLIREKSGIGYYFNASIFVLIMKGQVAIGVGTELSYFEEFYQAAKNSTTKEMNVQTLYDKWMDTNFFIQI